MKYLIALMLVMVASAGCRRYSQGFDAYFCTSTESARKGYLYIDNRRIGPLPYISYVPRAEEASLSGKLLYAHLNAGRHRLEVKDSEGNILFSGRMRAGRSGRSFRVSTSSEKRRWNSKVRVRDENLVAELMY